MPTDINPTPTEAALLSAALKARLRRVFFKTGFVDFIEGGAFNGGRAAHPEILKEMIRNGWLTEPRTVAPGEETGEWRITETGAAAREEYLRNPRRPLRAKRGKRK